MSFTRRRLLAAACFLAFASAVGAEPYPSRSVTLVAPSTPGSTPDVVSRLIAERLSAQLGQQVVVLNRPGAGGNIGSLAVANATPDGYTILLGWIANTINPHMVKSMSFDLSDLAPVSSVAAAPDILVVHPSVPAKTVAELVAMLKSKPGTPAGHAGVGTLPHLSLEMFRKMGRGRDHVRSVPRRGSAPAGSPGRPCAVRVPHDARCSSQHPQRPADGPRGEQRQAYRRSPGASYGRRVRIARFRFGRMVWSFCSGEHPETNHRSTERRGRQGARFPHAASQADRSWGTAAGQQPGRIRRFREG